MKNKWLNLVLLLTNRIYSKKQQIIEQAGSGVIYYTLILIILEIFLGIISLPLYLGLKSEKVTTFMAEKGAYAKVSFDYNLRRILTLSGVGIFALIWAIKMVFMIVLPAVYGPMRLYSVSGFSPANILTEDLIANETGIQTARVINTMPKPKITEAKKLKGGNYDFFGNGQPGSSVVLLLSGRQTAVYLTDVDSSGNWKISHSQAGFHLSEGNHSVIAFSYDKKNGARSEAAPEQFFKVTAAWRDSLIKNVDVLANWSAVIILFSGAFITFLII